MSVPIRTCQLSKGFRVRELNFELPSGSIFGLIGPNGAGKTTTIKLLMNILRPSSGSAEILGVNSQHLGPRQFERIGYFSENQEMPDEMTLEYFLRYLKPFYPKWDDTLCDQLVRQFDLPRKTRLRHLSRGMRMKAALASSLAYRPELVVLDEPFTGLDALVREELIEGLLGLAEGMTILISSHDLAEIESFASHVGYLDDGRLRFAEESSALSNRFRQVELIFETTPVLPREWPRKWIEPETAASVLRFVDTQFEQERTKAEVERLFPGARNVLFAPMGLTDIFVSLAKAGRSGASV